MDVTVPGCAGSVPCTTIPGETERFNHYLSPSTVVGGPESIWGVDFWDGFINTQNNAVTFFFVRAVRGGA